MGKRAINVQQPLMSVTVKNGRCLMKREEEEQFEESCIDKWLVVKLVINLPRPCHRLLSALPPTWPRSLVFLCSMASVPKYGNLILRSAI